MRIKPLILALLLGWNLANAQSIPTLSPQQIRSVKLRTPDDQPFRITLEKPAVFIFLSPECPLSKNYAPVLNALAKKNPSIAFYGIFPGKSYSSAEIDQFRKAYSINFPLLKDPLMQLTRHLKAKVTPEVLLVNGAGRIFYRGLIDNWAVSLGKKRQVVTNHYLDEAILRFKSGGEVAVKHTDPVGCLINDI